VTDALSLRGVGRTFPGNRLGSFRRRRGPTTPALEHIGLDLPAGTVTGILGPSGSGKTTVVRIAGLLDRPTSGTVAIEGEALDWQPAQLHRLRGRIGVVFQKPIVFRRSVLENAAFGLRLREDAASETKAMQMLRHVGLADLASRPARTLSGGEAQRLAFARAAVLRPKLLLLDEFTAHLDSRNAATLERLVKEYRAETGATVLLVTHSPAQARRLCDRVALLLDGKIVETGETTQVLENPQDPRAREFLFGDAAL